MHNHTRWLRYAAILLLLTAVSTIVLVSTGVFDPQPIGREQWRQSLSSQTLPPHSRQLHWLAQPLPDSPFTLRLTAAHQSGELDSGYGLAIGREERHLAVAVSPLGYVTIWQTSRDEKPADAVQSPVPGTSSLLPWQTWPHVRQGSGVNEIWVDVDRRHGDNGGQVTVRVNREWLWSGQVRPITGQAGLVAESFGKTAVIDFQTVQLFAPPPD